MTYREAFEQFWSIYPKRLDRNDAMKAFVATLRSGAKLADILRGVETYRQEILRGTIETKFVRKAHIWLGKGCWTDDYELNLPKAPPAQASQWSARYASWKGRGLWREEWGPRPDEPGTLCPRELMIREVS